MAPCPQTPGASLLSPPSILGTHFQRSRRTRESSLGCCLWLLTSFTPEGARAVPELNVAVGHMEPVHVHGRSALLALSSLSSQQDPEELGQEASAPKLMPVV